MYIFECKRRNNLQELFLQFIFHHFAEFRMSMLHVIAESDKYVMNKCIKMKYISFVCLYFKLISHEKIFKGRRMKVK